ncbi:polysaccharide deacetylase [Salinicoccus hispanicus]|uniref:Polysaccharide deacetylase family protein n=1 Tax=Salinicoccus hispanicus TaxID=157225 RepID=A0A6N8TYX0_9STAP|nr:polysaccharide deacetylase [Salinicoccus hispanicus]MXQ50980.1 polysaccharide deacetylase family protein [Salinicoccus hispanicus]
MNGNICVTFDFDAISLWMQRGMNTATPISRGEFGVVAIPRILTLLKKRDIKCTFFIPGHTLETYPDVCKQISADGHEIAMHGYLHENVTALSPEEEWAVLERSIKAVEDIIEVSPKGFRSPSWDLSHKTIEYLETLGIQYDSSQMGQDYSVYTSRKNDSVDQQGEYVFGEKSKVVEIPVSWSLDDYPYFEFLKTPTGTIPGLKTAADMFTNWNEDIQYMQRDFDNGVTVVTMHPQVIGRGHRLLGLERWLDSMVDQDLRFCRMTDIATRYSEGENFGVYKPE